jgi:hypothetical protein
VAGGVLAVALPIAVGLYRPAPGGFVFGNLGYHALRAAGGLYGASREALDAASAMVGVGAMADRSAAGPQFVLLLLLNAGARAAPRSHRGTEAAVGATTALWIAAATLRPNGLYEHYFTVVVPYLCLGAGPALASVVAPRVGWRALAPLCAMYLAAGIPSYEVHAVRAQYGLWNMAMHRPRRTDAAGAVIARAVRAHPGGLLAPWEGSAIGVAHALLPGFENHFGRNVAGALSPAERAAWHVPTHDDFVAALRSRRAAVFVLDRETEGPIRDALRALALRCGYTAEGPRLWMTEVFVRAPRGSPTPCEE